MHIHIDLGYHPVKSGLSLKVKVQIEIFECTGIMGKDLVHPYIQSTTVLCDSIRELELFQCRYENGYNLKTDKRYNQWLKVHHPQECNNYAKALIKVFMVVYKLSTAIRLHSESGLVTGRNRDGSGQAEKDTGRHGVFTVVCFKMCAHPLQSLYSYETWFREWPVSCKKQGWIRTSREGYRTSWCVHCSVLQNVCPPPTISLQLPDFIQQKTEMDGQAEKDTGRHGVFTVVCCKMCPRKLTK